MRAYAIFGLCAVGFFLAACGSADDGASGPGGSPGPDPGTTSGGPTNPGPDHPGDPPVDGPLAFTDRLAGWSGGYTGGFYMAHGYPISGDRLFSIPDAITSSLRNVTVVDVKDAAKPRVYSLPVTGKPPSGTVEAFSYDPALDRIVLAVRSGNEVLLATIAIGDKDAKIDTLNQVSAPKTNALMGPLYPTGAPGVIVAGAGNTTASFTISGTTATWSAESQGTIFAGNSYSPMADTAHGRVLSVGHYVYDPATMKAKLEPAITRLTLAPPYTWSALPFAGDPPPTSETTAYGFDVFDEKGNRILASFLHDVTCFPGQPEPCMGMGLWSFDLATNTWKKLADHWNSQKAYGTQHPYIVEQARRRILTPLDGTLAAASLEATTPDLNDVSLVGQDGDLGPSSPIAATTLADGRIVSSNGGVFRVIDPKSPSLRWTRHGTVRWPASGVDGYGSLAADPKTGELLVFGSQNGAAPELHVVSADAKTITKVTPAGGSSPSARTQHGALVVDGTMWMAGGVPALAASTALDDLWTFDRAASSWTKVATLGTGVLSTALAIAPNGDLLVLGRTPGDTSKPSSLFAIDRKTHVVKTLAAPPAKNSLWAIAPYRGCFLGYESGGTVDASGLTAWRCEIDGNGAVKWTSTTIAEHDFLFHEHRAAGSPDGLHAYFVGRHLWDVVGK